MLFLCWEKADRFLCLNSKVIYGVFVTDVVGCFWFVCLFSACGILKGFLCGVLRI